MLASNQDATRSVGIQVKTSQRGRPEWVLSSAAEVADTAENLFYVFVLLNGLERPTYRLHPRNEVAEFVRRDHAEWLKRPGRLGRAHKDNPVRKFQDRDNRYVDRWDLLGL